MNRWQVLLEFRTDHPAFEMLVEAPSKQAAILAVERFACESGWADAELRSVTVTPILPAREVA